ncbi:hypothetical protein A5634_20510 [Mycobacterium asiaticum]|uniref:Uncharacterized protein n=1 Tax=Mycobacterium asiaticum TaxID=1790 RepID=A0A1A3P591_MYCAS|nr:hypothetical protein [Mycobacterium asiaticum]OBK28464.1 hypothetical protein A5634_20510 [Mycobacterium asiaticum]
MRRYPRQDHRSTTKPLVIAISVLLVMAALAIPIKQRCGAPGRTCATAVDANGDVHYYYEVEPLGIFLIENMIGSDIPLFYTSGEEIVKVR